MIEFENVTKIYDKTTTAIKNVSLKIDSGEFVFIVGPSGSGKTTLLKMIMREEDPTHGRIIINGTDITALKRSKIPYLRRTMGVVFQDFRLIEKMSVYENIEFAMDVIGATEREKRKRVPYVLGLVGLSDKASRRPSELSGGEQQRVGMARALVNNPYMIIADEPTGNIDPSMSFDIVDLLGEINKCGTTVIMVTHDIGMVKRFPFRVVEISNGEVKNDLGRRSEEP